MSQKYSGGFITKSPVAPTTSAASGIWTLDQQQQAQKAGTWPSPPIFIEDLFSTFLYTGNGGTQTITNNIDLSGQGGLVWTKCRSFARNNGLTDTATGASKYLSSDQTSAQGSYGGVINAFSSSGYTTGSDTWYNEADQTYVSWTFREQPKFFDIVTYTGNGTNRTIAHSLGSVPGSIIVKRTDTTADWAVYHRSLANTQYLVLNTTAAVATGATWWNSTTPTSSVFSVGTDASVNASGGTYVAYIFAHDAGGFGLTGTDNVISCGSVTYDSTNGNTINLGYEAQFVIVKSATAVTQWYMQDIMRGMASGPDSGARLFPNLANAEDAAFIVGPTATGFNIKPSFFSNGNNVIYIAIRRGPMKTPTVGTSVFNLQNSTEPVSTPIFSAGTAPPDVVLNFPRYDGVAGPFWLDRLRGNARSLTSATTAAETSPTAVIPPWFFNTEQRATIAAGAYYNNSGGSPLVQYSFIRAPSFFDEVCYTGNGSAGGQTITHNLTVTPELIIVKRRDSVEQWRVYAASQGVSAYAALNSTAAFATDANNPWKTPTSTTFGVGDGTYWTSLNASAGTYVAYLFATLAGVSKVGSYTGTGALQTVNCGFTSGSRFVLIKRTDSTGDWYTYDSARGITSGNDPYLLLNSSAAEVTGTNYVDTDTTGFKVTAAAPAGLNANGGTYIFLAIA